MDKGLCNTARVDFNGHKTKGHRTRCLEYTYAKTANMQSVDLGFYNCKVANG